MIIGICGKSGSGKSTLANKLKEINPNIIHLDIDKVGHKVLTFNDVQEELVKTFGDSIIDENIINRKKLGEIVFTSRLEMSKLSDITWKYMQIEIDKFLSDNSDKIVILDYLLLPITKYFDMCDYKILLDVSYEIRKKRAMERDNITSQDFDLRESASISLNPQEFDFVLNNSNDIKRLVKIL